MKLLPHALAPRIFPAHLCDRSSNLLEAGKQRVFLRHHRKSCAMGCRVIRSPRKSKAKRIGRARSLRILQLFLQILDEIFLRDLEPTGFAGFRDRTEKLEMRQPADVIQIQRVTGIARPSDVRIRPMRRRLQIKIWIRLFHPRRQRPIRTREREVKFRRPEFHVIAPFRFAIEIER